MEEVDIDSIDDETKAYVEQSYGISGDEIKKLAPGWFKLIAHRDKLAKLRTIFEVIDVSHCSLPVKVGDKLVIDRNVINAEESTFPLCINALDRLQIYMFMIYDRIAEGLDPNGLFFKTVDCADQGLEWGGTGKVRFKVYTEWRDE
jgi:uncharacterized repeat protein (TIGR04076 family)